MCADNRWHPRVCGWRLLRGLGSRCVLRCVVLNLNSDPQTQTQSQTSTQARTHTDKEKNRAAETEEHSDGVCLCSSLCAPMCSRVCVGKVQVLVCGHCGVSDVVKKLQSCSACMSAADRDSASLFCVVGFGYLFICLLRRLCAHLFRCVLCCVVQTA